MKFYKPLVAVLVALILFFALARLREQGAERDAHSTLRMQLSTEPVTLDYSLAEDGTSFRVLSALMVGLVAYDRDYNIQMKIAESMERLDGGKRYRFKLRPWKWSDGKEVSVGDFLFAFQRTLEPGTPSKLADLLFFIKNARAYKRGEIKDFSQVGISSPAANVLEFTLDAPVSFFPHVLTLPVGYPQREGTKKMVTTGPYQMTRWLHDQRIEIEQNPFYPDFSPTAARRAVFQIVPEEATALNLFENNQLDVLFKVPSFDVARLRKQQLVYDYPYFATYYIAFDQRQAPWGDRKARLAVAQALNRRAIVDALGGLEQEASSWIPVGVPAHNAALGVKHDVAQAKKNWLHSSAPDRQRLVMGYDTSFRNQSVIERIQADLKEVLDVQLQLRNRDWKTYLNELSHETPPLYRFGWLSPFVDPYASLVVFQSDNPNNYTGWKNKTYDELLERIAALESRDPKRQDLIDRAQRLLLEEAVTVVPIFHYVQTVIVSKRVKNFWVNGLGMVDYMSLSVED